MMLLSKTGVGAIRGAPLIALITSCCSAGFLLFGYDQGVMSGVVISDFWLSQMGNPSTLMVGTITALYDVGAVAGAIGAAFMAEPLGRKATLMLGALILLVGSMIMGCAFERIQFMVGRIITGVGIGFITSVCAVYQAEISSQAQRGWQVCCQLTTMLFGLMLAYWINYGFYFHRNSVQWRFPLLFQCVFCVYILVFASLCPDTPRWLLAHMKTPEEGLGVLARLRNLPESAPMVQQEKDNILAAIAIESQEEGGWGDLFKSNGIAAHKRFYLALGIQFMQQMTGINIVTYYAPTLYQTSLGMSPEEALFLGCWTQVFYVAASFVTWYTIDRVGRRKLFISMALGMCIVLVCEAICVGVGSHGAAIAAVFFIFMFQACFTWGWMATVWVYPPEILPLKIRAKGSALAAAADFLGNFLVVEVTPIGLKNLGYRFYIVWAVFNIACAIIVFIFYPETAGLPLEAIDELFMESSNVEGIPSNDRKLYNKLQWHVVGRSIATVKEQKQMGHNKVDDEERLKKVHETVGSARYVEKARGSVTSDTTV